MKKTHSTLLLLLYSYKFNTKKLMRKKMLIIKLIFQYQVRKNIFFFKNKREQMRYESRKK